MKTFTFFVSLIIFFLCGVCYAQWSEQTSGITTALYSVNACDSSVVWTCGASGKVLKTTNGGVTWTTYTITQNPSLALYCIWGIDAQTALVTGSSSTTYLYRTSNGGVNWSEVLSQSGGFINTIGPLASSGYLGISGDPVGGRWTLFVSSDQGISWDSTGHYLPQSGSEAGWNNSAYTKDTVNGPVGIGTNNTRIYRFVGGWAALPTPGLTNSYALWANYTNSIMAGGTVLLYSANGGSSWTDVSAPGSGNILGIAGSGAKWWYVRGSSVYYSLNNGTNWVTDYTSTGTYYDIAIASTGQIWAVKSNGGISKFTIPVGINPITSEIPKQFALCQNYPNPFNPLTNIKIQIAKQTTASLKIFDELGREVSTLLNEQLKPGTYEIQWDASNYPSGVYYYRLIAGDFIETKKMVLVK